MWKLTTVPYVREKLTEKKGEETSCKELA